MLEEWARRQVQRSADSAGTRRRPSVPDAAGHALTVRWPEPR